MRYVPFLFLLMFLTGCMSSAVVQSPDQPTTTPRPTGETAVRTLLPAPSATPSRPVETPAQPATAYPITTEQNLVAATPAYPYPYPAPSQGIIEKAGSSSAPFHDCARTPGLAGCDPQALPLTGRLGLSDRASARLVVLDLSSGKGWQSPGISDGLDWSPAADQLLTWHDTEGGRRYALLGASGDPLQSPTTDEILRWQPDGSLTPQNILAYPGGREVRLELTADGRWLLHARIAANQERTLTVDPQPADRQYLLLDRVPGTEQVLAQSFFPTNLGMASGGGLLLIDPQSEKVQLLGIDAPLPPSANLAWNPSRPALLAFTASGAEPGMTVLSLFDFSTQELIQPLPQGVQVTSLDWRPDGQRLAFTAEPLPGVISAADQKNFPTPGVYLFDLASGKVEALLPSPQGAVDGWVCWSADGKMLLYGRLLRSPAGSTTGEIHAFALEGKRDAILFNALEMAQGPRSQAAWQSFVSYAR